MPAETPEQAAAREAHQAGYDAEEKTPKDRLEQLQQIFHDRTSPADQEILQDIATHYDPHAMGPNQPLSMETQARLRMGMDVPGLSAQPALSSRRGDRAFFVNEEDAASLAKPPNENGEAAILHALDGDIRGFNTAIEALGLRAGDGAFVTGDQVRPQASPTGAPTITLGPDGLPLIHFDQQAWAKTLLEENHHDSTLAQEHGRAQLAEEIWHASHLLVLRNDWIKEGKMLDGKGVTFEKWLNARSKSILDDVHASANRATPAEKKSIQEALVGTWQLYFARTDGEGTKFRPQGRKGQRDSFNSAAKEREYPDGHSDSALPRPQSALGPTLGERGLQNSANIQDAGNSPPRWIQPKGWQGPARARGGWLGPEGDSVFRLNDVTADQFGLPRGSEIYLSAKGHRTLQSLLYHFQTVIREYLGSRV